MDRLEIGAKPTLESITEDEWIEANPELIHKAAIEILPCFQSAHTKLRKLPVEAVNELARKIAVRSHFFDSKASPWDRRSHHPRYRPALEAWSDAEKHAAQLHRAIAGFLEHGTAVWGDLAASEPDDELPQLASALERVFRLSVSPRPPVPWSDWRIIVGMASNLVLKILRTNGFRNASMKSEGGPAPAVMENLIRLWIGDKCETVTATTIAREVRRSEQRRLIKSAGKQS